MNDSPLTSKTTNKNKPNYASTGEYRRYKYRHSPASRAEKRKKKKEII